MVFPVVMYGCEVWTIKKAEHWRIDAFELWCWRRLLRVPWTVRRSNQSILKEISPGCSLEGLMLKLKLQYFGHLMWREDSFEKTLMLGKIEGRRRRGRQRMRWLDGITDSTDMSLGVGTTLGVGDGHRGLACCGSWGHKESDTTEQLNWTIPGTIFCLIFLNCAIVWWKGLNFDSMVLVCPLFPITFWNSKKYQPFLFHSHCPSQVLIHNLSNILTCINFYLSFTFPSAHLNFMIGLQSHGPPWCVVLKAPDASSLAPCPPVEGSGRLDRWVYRSLFQSSWLSISLSPSSLYKRRKHLLRY